MMEWLTSHLILPFHFYFAFLPQCTTANPYINRGKYSIQQWDDNFYFRPYQNLSYALSIFTPKDEAGTYNILLFFTGLDGICPSFFYSDVFSHISSYGYIIVSASIFDFDTNATLRAQEIQDTIDWIRNDLSNNMESHGIDTSQIKPNITQLCIGSHSSAAHPLVQLLNSSCSIINAVYLQDPVDCHSPYKPDVDCVTTPGKKLPFAVPLLHIETGLDPKSIRFAPPCAPASESNQRFVDAWNGPIYQINATMFGHMDLVDDQYVHDFNTACLSCEMVYNKTNCDNAQYRNGIGGWVVSFLEMVYAHHANYSQYLIEPQLWLNNITLIPKQYYNGYSTETPAFCERV